MLVASFIIMYLHSMDLLSTKKSSAFKSESKLILDS